MPELPEVEVTRRALVQTLRGRKVTGAILRTTRLREPVPADLPDWLAGVTLREVARRGKYLLLAFERGHLLVHLGMSGSLRLVLPGAPTGAHDHLDLVFGDLVLRFTDPRRFGLIDWLEGEPARDSRLSHLGLEPLSPEFSGEWLAERLRLRRAPIKPALMDAQFIVGVGNIYAAESLFVAGIDPRRPAQRISRERLFRLAEAIRATLEAAIRAGGSTLRDFCSPAGFGDFQVSHQVYGRAGQPCFRCGTPIRRIVQAGRSTFFCPRCQR